MINTWNIMFDFAMCSHVMAVTTVTLVFPPLTENVGLFLQVLNTVVSHFDTHHSETVNTTVFGKCSWMIEQSQLLHKCIRSAISTAPTANSGLSTWGMNSIFTLWGKLAGTLSGSYVGTPHCISLIGRFCRLLLMLRCIARNQIFQCSPLPLSLMCECRIVRIHSKMSAAVWDTRQRRSWCIYTSERR